MIGGRAGHDELTDLRTRLDAVRDQHAAAPYEKRLGAVEEALRAALEPLPPERRQGTVDALRDQLVAEARSRVEQFAELEAAQQALTAERDRLARENDELRAQAEQAADEHAGALERARAEARTVRDEAAGLRGELDTMRAELERSRAAAEQAARDEAALGALREELAQRTRERDEARAAAARPAAPPPPPAPAAPASGGEALEHLRQGLRETAETNALARETGDLPSAEYRLLRLTQELLKFALEYDRGVQAFLLGLSIVPGMDTRQLKRYEEEVRQRFIDCLDDRSGSIGRLQEVLDRNRRFLVDLNEAYHEAIPHGVHEMLGTLDPAPMLEGSRGTFRMADHEKAWRTFSERHAELAELPTSELMSRYFLPAIQQELTGRRS
jgi:DNA repair exonuclease SbcCD ATPase subunit